MKNEKLSEQDQAMVDLIKNNYVAPDLNRIEAARFDEKLSARVSKSRGIAWGPWALALCLLLVFVAIGFNQKQATPALEHAPIVATQDDYSDDLEWMETLLDEETPSVEFEELPEEYVAMMMIMDSDSEEYDDY